MTDYDFKADVNVTFRGECRCQEGEMYIEDDFGYGFCSSECMFGTYSPKSDLAEKCLKCDPLCSECTGPTATDCLMCSPWAFMVDGKEGMCVEKCPAGYKAEGSNSTDFNS